MKECRKWGVWLAPHNNHWKPGQKVLVVAKKKCEAGGCRKVGLSANRKEIKCSEDVLLIKGNRTTWWCVWAVKFLKKGSLDEILGLG